MRYSPIAGLEQVEKTDLRPGDEIVWSWEGSQILGTTHYVHCVLPSLDGASDREMRKQKEEFDMIISRDRAFYRVPKSED